MNNIYLFSGNASPGTKGAASSLGVIKSLRLKIELNCSFGNLIITLLIGYYVYFDHLRL